MDAAAYRQHLQALLPTGLVWRWLLAGNLSSMLLAFGKTLARVDAKIVGLLGQIDPRTTAEFLDEWEAFVGLPDGCMPMGGSAEQRRQAIRSRLVAVGGASKAYFIEVAALLGYTITIDEIATNVWRINSAEVVQITYFRAGRSHAGDRLREFGNDQFECLFNRIKPAHTVLHFAYGV